MVIHLHSGSASVAVGRVSGQGAFEALMLVVAHLRRLRPLTEHFQEPDDDGDTSSDKRALRSVDLGKTHFFPVLSVGGCAFSKATFLKHGLERKQCSR